MRARAISARKVFLRHPWAVTLFESRTTMTPRGSTTPFGVEHSARRRFCRRGGVQGVSAHRQLPVWVHVAGAELVFDETQTRKMAAQMAPQIAAAGHKHVAEVMLHLSCEPGLDRDEEFERGLGLVLDGLERLRE